MANCGTGTIYVRKRSTYASRPPHRPAPRRSPATDCPQGPRAASIATRGRWTIRRARRPAVGPVPAAGGSPLAIVAVWRMPRNEYATRIAIYFALIGIVITSGPALVTPRLPPTVAWPALVMLGVFSTAAHVLFAGGCLIAPAHRGSILNYTSVFFAAVLAWVCGTRGWTGSWLLAQHSSSQLVSSQYGRRPDPRCRRCHPK